MPNRPTTKPPPAVCWQVSRTERNSYKVLHTASRWGDTLSALLITDVHWDSKDCRRDLLKADMERAKELGSPVFIFGDLFDVMEGKYDPRRHKDQIRPELSRGDYLDAVVDQSVKWFAPYARNIALVSPGNHEQSIRDRLETDLIQRFVDGLRANGATTIRGGYWGFVTFLTRITGMKAACSKVLHYHHGYGGGGEVTRGMIDNNRTRGQYDADVFVSGHIHRRNDDENVIVRCGPTGRIRKQLQVFLRSGTYKDEMLSPAHHEEQDSWHISKGRAARPVGGWWLKLAPRRRDNTDDMEIRYERT